MFGLLDIYIVRDWFRFLTLESGDFAAGSLIMPLVLSSSGQLPDWDNIAFSRQQNGRQILTSIVIILERIRYMGDRYLLI